MQEAVPEIPTTYSPPPTPVVYPPKKQDKFFSIIFLFTIFLIGIASGYILAQLKPFDGQTPPLTVSSESQTK